jgi:hypothetical protein
MVIAGGYLKEYGLAGWATIKWRPAVIDAWHFISANHEFFAANIENLIPEMMIDHSFSRLVKIKTTPYHRGQYAALFSA